MLTATQRPPTTRHRQMHEPRTHPIKKRATPKYTERVRTQSSRARNPPGGSERADAGLAVLASHVRDGRRTRHPRVARVWSLACPCARLWSYDAWVTGISGPYETSRPYDIWRVESSVVGWWSWALWITQSVVYYNMLWTAERVEIDRKIPYPCLPPEDATSKIDHSQSVGHYNALCLLMGVIKASTFEHV